MLLWMHLCPDLCPVVEKAWQNCWAQAPGNCRVWWAQAPGDLQSLVDTDVGELHLE